ncbi:MAG TPA: AraC family transcriptional regulator [Casimicrobiaceae bacterium]|nr:AraC family transcriptional regulator [Casimicrobiaceae bacterium]
MIQTEQDQRPAGGGGTDVLQMAVIGSFGENAIEREDAISILVPGEQCAFHVTHSAADGRVHRAFVRAPHIAVVPPREACRVQSAARSDMVVIALDAAFYERKAGEACVNGPPRLVARYAAVDPFLREIANTLKDPLRVSDPGTGPYLESIASVIAVHLARNYAGGKSALPAYVGLAPHKLKRVQQHIAVHLFEAIPVKDLAAIVHMSPYHFARMFRKATGQPPHLYITTQRIDHARSLLADGKLSLADVAARVGFQTQSHFTEVFRKHTGMTPGTFRARCELASPARAQESEMASQRAQAPVSSHA